MPNESTLVIRQSYTQDGRYQAAMSLKVVGQNEIEATSDFDFYITAQEYENLRWYLEDYLVQPYDPAPRHAREIEQWMRVVGLDLFNKIFRGSQTASDLWAAAKVHLSTLRVKVSTGVSEATTIPWELLRDPASDQPLALQVKSFVRSQSNTNATASRRTKRDTVVRILLVICRPRGGSDVAFRSVASHILKTIDTVGRSKVQLDVLRPPSFEQLTAKLEEAKAAGQPYQIVHFDGHGQFLDLAELQAAWATADQQARERIMSDLTATNPTRFSPQLLYPGPPRAGKHGYLVFENDADESNTRFVGGPELGALLVNNGVSVLILNACQSAYAEPPTEPPQLPTGAVADLQDKVRAFGSLAQEVVNAKVAGVVAMRYSVYVVTAAQFVYELYRALLGGQSLGEAVQSGRKQLHADPYRKIAFEQVPLQDWVVPVVYEANPIAPFKSKGKPNSLPLSHISVNQPTPQRGNVDQKLPPEPAIGFIGRDETILALDRAFDRHPLVLLHAYAGSGKTSTAAEFARWYSFTGGVNGPVLFSSFTQRHTLNDVLADFGRAFDGWLKEEYDILWATLSPEEQRDVALQALQLKPVLWVWDNIEPITGFPSGSESAWQPEEQAALHDFLRDASRTEAKFLLTSRRDEWRWLGDLQPRLVQMPPMPLQERVQLAEALADRQGQRLNIAAWRPLLDYTAGNPLTLTVMVGQAVRDGLRERVQIENYVARLRAGEQAFADEQTEARDRSLAASLDYGFAHAFSATERQQLALLHLFQDKVFIAILRVMGDPDAAWHVPAVRGLTDEQATHLLDRAAEIGLLTAHGNGYYSIHPALPWFLKREFDRAYPDPQVSIRAFVEAVAGLSLFYTGRIIEVNDRRWLVVLANEEANLRHAWQLARSNGWLALAAHVLHGITAIYRNAGRNAELDQVLAIARDDYLDEQGGPRPGLAEEWSVLTDRMFSRLRDQRRWLEAEQLLTSQIAWHRRESEAALATPLEQLDQQQRNVIRNLTAVLGQLGQFQILTKQPTCAATYGEVIKLAQRIGDRPLGSIAAYDLGSAYLTIPGLRDLDQAERWYQQSIVMSSETNGPSQAHVAYQLGQVAYERFKEARNAKAGEEALRQANIAADYYQQALRQAPAESGSLLDKIWNALGSLYTDVGQVDQALDCYRKSVGYRLAADDQWGAAETRYNAAVALRRADRNRDALRWAEAALRDFEGLGPAATEDVERTSSLIADIKEDIAKEGQTG